MKKGSVESLKTATAVRLQPEGLKQPMHGGFRNPAGLGGLAHAPLRGSGRLARERPLKQGGDAIVVDAARPAGTQLVIQPSQAVLDKPPPPFAHGSVGPVQTAGNLAVALTLDRPQHQPGTGHQGMGQGARGGQASQLGLLVGSQGDGWLGRPVRMHGSLLQINYLRSLFMGHNTSRE
jgi:hypothetical protein